MKTLGFDIPTPKKVCHDKTCPFHGTLHVRGSKFAGTVVSKKTHKTVIVEWERRRLVTKYDRYEKRKTRIQAHNPECIDAKEGDKVSIMECRPISKTKHFTIVQVQGIDDEYLLDKAEKKIEKEAIEPKAKEPSKKPIAKKKTVKKE